MKDRTEEPILLPPVNQIGIVVRDAEKVSRYYSSIFGIGPFTTYDMNLTRATLNGKPAPTSLRMVIARMGPVEIELIQVLDGGDFYTGFLDTHGEGLHHLRGECGWRSVRQPGRRQHLEPNQEPAAIGMQRAGLVRIPQRPQPDSGRH